MSWRARLLSLALAVGAAAFVCGWPETPLWKLDDETSREFVFADADARRLLFLCEPQGRLPIVERRDLATGRLVTAVTLDGKELLEVSKFADKDGYASGPETHFSAGGRFVFWSQRATNSAHDILSRCAVFDTATGRRQGPIVETKEWIGFVSLSPDGRWVLMWSLRNRHCLCLLDVQAGQPATEFPAPPRDWSTAAGSFSPDGRWVLFQYGNGPELYQVNVATRAVERTHRLAAETRVGNDDVWETLVDWRPGELRTELTHVDARTTQSFNWSFRKRKCRRHFDAQSLGEGVIDPLLDGPYWDDAQGSRGEGGGWVARAVRADDSESMFSQCVSKVESWFGGGLLVNWQGRFGSRNTVQVIGRTTNSVRYEATEWFCDKIQVVLDGSTYVRTNGDRIEVCAAASSTGRSRPRAGRSCS